MNSICQAKAALLGCSCKSQVMSVVDAFCSKTRFDYSADLSLSDNAIIAQRMDKQKIANVLSFAAQQLDRL